MLQIKINGDKLIYGQEKENSILINEIPFSWDISKIDNNTFHIIKNNISYTAEIIQADPQFRNIEIKINNKIFRLEIKDKYDLLMQQAGIKELLVSKTTEIKAPMPGLIVSMNAIEGQKVKAGETLLILEAMKMENIIKSPADAIIKSIHAKSGDKVEKNQILIRF